MRDDRRPDDADEARAAVPADDRPVLVRDTLEVLDDPAPVQHRRGVLTALLAALVCVSVVLVVVTVATWLARGSQGGLAAPPAGSARHAAAPKAAPPAGLTVAVTGPSAVRVGQVARYRVHYADGAGVFSGTTEDWGDVGVGSASQASCAGAPTARPLDATYAARHRWTRAGTYQLRLGVTTYTCSGGTASQETQEQSLTVVVSR